MAAPGNHDIAPATWKSTPTAWPISSTGTSRSTVPLGAEGDRLVPPLHRPEANRQAFLAAAGTAYPRMANFSFDYGNAHWTVLDSNPYVDWTDPELRAWVERDLAAAETHTWRFVAFHHPASTRRKAHFDDQQMRLLADVFEAGRVDVVFSGHVHNYQRTYPLRFTPEKDRNGKPVRDQNKVPGRWTLDKAFDGRAAHGRKG